MLWILLLGEILSYGQTGPGVQVAVQLILVYVEIIGIVVVLVDHEVLAGLVEALVAPDHPDVGVAQIGDAVQHVEIGVVGIAVDALGVGGVIVVDVAVIEGEVAVLELEVEAVVAEIPGDPEGETDVGVLPHMDGAAADVLQVVDGLLHRVEVLTVVGLADGVAEVVAAVVGGGLAIVAGAHGDQVVEGVVGIVIVPVLAVLLGELVRGGIRLGGIVRRCLGGGFGRRFRGSLGGGFGRCLSRRLGGGVGGDLSGGVIHGRITGLVAGGEGEEQAKGQKGDENVFELHGRPPCMLFFEFHGCVRQFMTGGISPSTIGPPSTKATRVK